MQRLLMGEVGSGKTVVALYAMLRALESGRQAALMAPTETLAEQHFATLETLLAGMPVPIGLLTGGLDFSKLEWVLRPENPATEAVEKVSVQYGAFINTLIQFFIVAMVVFLLVKVVNGIRRADAAEPAPAAPPAPTPEEKLLTEIRDLLAKPR